MNLPPDFEKTFREYLILEQGGDSRDAMALAVLGDSAYTNKVKMKGYNGPVDMLREPKVAIKNVHNWGIPTSKHAHAQRAQFFKDLAFAMDVVYQEYINETLQRFGDGDGRLISGSIRSHFPENVKNRLRFLAHGLPMVKDAARLHTYLSKTRSPQFA